MRNVIHAFIPKTDNPLTADKDVDLWMAEHDLDYQIKSAPVRFTNDIGERFTDGT